MTAVRCSKDSREDLIPAYSSIFFLDHAKSGSDARSIAIVANSKSENPRLITRMRVHAKTRSILCKHRGGAAERRRTGMQGSPEEEHLNGQGLLWP